MLAEELKLFGAKKIKKIRRAVTFEGDQEVMYRCNLHSRLALKILKVIDTSTTYDEGRLYRNVKRINWPAIFNIQQTFAIDAITSGSIFTHNHYVALKAKDAIVDRFREESGKRPSVDKENPDIRINLHIQDRKCTILLDSSGNSLDKRGYKQNSVPAPLSEVLAAGLLKIADWHGQRDLLDPMCGSGTIAIEAALLASNIAAGSFRTFAFQNWPDYDQKLWMEMKEESKAQEKVPSCQIIALDKDGKAVNAARANSRRAGLYGKLKVIHADYMDYISELNNPLLIMNPPYGERLEKNLDIEQLYASIGDRLKQHYQGCEAWILSANLPALKRVGLRASEKTEIYNGPLEARFNKYELFRGPLEK